MNQEKRKQERMAADYQIFLTYQGHALPARSRDISPRGIGLYCEADLAPGATVTMRVFVPKATLNVEVEGRVCYCIRNPEPSPPSPQRLAGIEFLKDLEDGMPIAGPPGKEHRYSASHSVSIEAPALVCYQAIADFERYPEWAGVVIGVRPLSRYPDGRIQRVEFENNYYLLKVRYVNEYLYDDRRLCLSWAAVGGDLTSNQGNWSFRPQGENQASATFQITIGLNFRVSERIMKYMSLVVMRKSMRDFKNYVEKKDRTARPAE